MTPAEFVARMVDAIDEVPLTSRKGKAKTWSGVALMLPKQTKTDMNGYTWEVRTAHALNHAIVEATLQDGFTGIGASVCFNTLVPEPEMLAHWHTHSSPTEHHVEGQMCMLAMLTLKTSVRVREII